MAAISRLVRRVCLLREEGNPAEASAVESGDLAAAVRSFREEQGSEALTDADIERIFSVERERVANAAALCELLLPRLSASQDRGGGVDTEPVARRSPAPKPISPREPAAQEGPPGITELLDAMLAAERTGRRVTQDPRPKNRTNGAHESSRAHT